MASVKVRAYIEVAEGEAKVGVDVPRAPLPPGGPRLQAQQLLRELEAQRPEFGQREGRHGREYAPPKEFLWKEIGT